jgi:hypothetical protein
MVLMPMWYNIDLANLKSSLEFPGVQTPSKYCNKGIYYHEFYI